MGKGVIQVLSGMTVAVLFAVPTAEADQHMHGANAKDERQVIALNAAGRSLVLAEMRQFLTAVQSLTEALSKDDLKTAAQAARSVGMQAAQEVPPEVKAKLPKEFKQLGFSVHSEFDQLALDADGLGDAKHTLKQMGEVLQKCVACHNTYRIDEVSLPLAKR